MGELSAASAVKPTISLKIAFKLIFNTWRNSSSQVQIKSTMHWLTGAKSNSVEAEETMHIYQLRPSHFSKYNFQFLI